MVKLDSFKQYLDMQGYAYDCDVPMKGYTTFKVGGPAPIFIKAKSVNELCAIVRQANELDVEFITLGKGSNLLVNDSGLDCPVIHLGEHMSGMELVGEDTIFAEAGATLTRLCRFAMENSLTGLEFAFGIPGSVGGAVYMNAGAYGGEIKDVVTKATHIDGKGNIGCYEGGDLCFDYRHSAYTGSDKIITGAFFKLSKGDREQILKTMEETMQKRIDKQPLEYPSAGSTFKRPKGDFASALIDRCGLKGLSVGGAMVSEKHAGFIINYDNASCGDIKELIAKVQQIVCERTGYELECEVRFL